MASESALKITMFTTLLFLASVISWGIVWF